MNGGKAKKTVDAVDVNIFSLIELLAAQSSSTSVKTIFFFNKETLFL